MYELPLFPLSTVLFPGAPLQLHIFEPRYREMIQACLDERRPFGVVYIRSGDEANGPLAEPHDIGCMAEIVRVERLPDGRMNLVVLGLERFRILSLDAASRPYLVGQVEAYPLEPSETDDLKVAGQRVREQMERYLRYLVEAGVSDLESGSLPEDPLELGFLAAALVQTAQEDKQSLLEIGEAGTFLEEVIGIYQKELSLVKILLHDEGRSQGVFSVN
jgi:uncharacterized protein